MERVCSGPASKIVPFRRPDDICWTNLTHDRLGFIEELVFEDGMVPQDDVSSEARGFILDSFSDHVDDVIDYKHLIIPIKYFWREYTPRQLAKMIGLTTQATTLGILSTMIRVWQNAIPESQLEQSLDKIIRLKPGDSLLSSKEQNIKENLVTTTTIDTNDLRLIGLISERVGLTPTEKEFIGRDNIHLGGRTCFGGLAVSSAIDLYVKWLTTDQDRYLRTLKRYLLASAQEWNLHHPFIYQTGNVDHIEKPTKKGYIYVIKAGERYKIGRTINNGYRLKTHQTSSPVEVSLVFERQTDDCVGMELELHELFSDKRVKGEWFTLDEEDLQTIAEYFTN